MDESELISRLANLEDRLSDLESGVGDIAYFAAQRAKSLAMHLDMYCKLLGEESFGVIPLSATEVDIIVYIPPGKKVLEGKYESITDRIEELAGKYRFQVKGISVIPKK